MQDIQVNPEDVRRFQTETRAIGRDIVMIQDALKKCLVEVSAYWKDGSLDIAKRDIDEINRKMLSALSQLDGAVDKALKRELDWTERYNKVR